MPVYSSLWMGRACAFAGSSSVFTLSNEPNRMKRKRIFEYQNPASAIIAKCLTGKKELKIFSPDFLDTLIAG